MTPETPDPPPVSPDPVQVDLHRAVDYYVPRGDVRTLKGEIDRARAADALRHQQEIAAKDHEIAGLKSDVAFKDSLIWTSRESELYKATVAAEKDAKAARAERDALQVQVDKKAQAFDDECGRHEQTLIGKRGFADLVAQLGAERDAAQQEIDGWVRIAAENAKDATARLDAAQQQIATLTAALSSIANSSCCGCCQEAALVARAVLGSSGLQDELLDDTARALWHALCEGDGQHSEALDVAIIAAHLQRFAMLTEQQRETTNRLLRDAADFIDNHGPNAHDTDDERHNNEDCAFCQAKGIVGGIRSVLLDAALQSTRPQEQP